MKSLKYKTTNITTLNHPYINDVLVYDIETNGLNITTAKMVWFGAYSYKHQKYFIGTPEDKEKIQALLDEHKVLVGWNNHDFDNPIMENEINNYDINYKICVDGLRILHTKEKHKDNRKPIIQLENGQHLDSVCKSNKLRDIGKALNCNVIKGDINYKIFKQNTWTSQQIKEIEHYLFADVALTREIFEYFVEYFDTFKDMVNEEDIRKFNYIRSSTGSFAYSAISKAVGKETMYPEQDRKSFKKKCFSGGYVLEPVKEYAENVIYFDFASLYPHIEFMCNLFSPVNTENVHVWNGDNFFNIQGVYNAERQGVIEKQLQRFYNLRNELKKKGDPRELAYKIVINSIYGISSVPVFMNVYNETVASDTTLIGQQMIKYAQTIFEKSGFNVIAMDTDSCFVELNGKNKNDAIKVARVISDNILLHVPFPCDSFELKVDDLIKKIWFPGCKKKHYAYINVNNEFKIKGLEFIKNDASLLGQKMFKFLKPFIIERGNVKFGKEFISEKAMMFIHEDFSLVGRLYRVRDLDSYKSKSSIQAQISAKFGEGTFLLIPNTRVGDVGKSKLFCGVDRADELCFDDLVLDKFWKEMELFL